MRLKKKSTSQSKKPRRNIKKIKVDISGHQTEELLQMKA